MWLGEMFRLLKRSTSRGNVSHLCPCDQELTQRTEKDLIIIMSLGKSGHHKIPTVMSSYAQLTTLT